MSHFAKVLDGKVTQVIVAEPEFFQNFVDTSPGEWIQTSYNTVGNQHPEGRPLRGNYAGVGFIYDRENDVFYAPKPYPSWALNKTNWTWEAPVPCPPVIPEENKMYKWDESIVNWVSLPTPPAGD
jgi:hypothetical protein